MPAPSRLTILTVENKNYLIFIFFSSVSHDLGIKIAVSLREAIKKKINTIFYDIESISLPTLPNYDIIFYDIVVIFRYLPTFK